MLINFYDFEHALHLLWGDNFHFYDIPAIVVILVIIIMALVHWRKHKKRQDKMEEELQEKLEENRKMNQTNSSDPYAESNAGTVSGEEPYKL